MEWNNLDFKYILDNLAVVILLSGAVLYMARRTLRSIFPALAFRSGRALVLDRGEQTSCSSCSIADRHRTTAEQK